MVLSTKTSQVDCEVTKTVVCTIWLRGFPTMIFRSNVPRAGRSYATRLLLGVYMPASRVSRTMRWTTEWRKRGVTGNMPACTLTCAR